METPKKAGEGTTPKTMKENIKPKMETLKKSGEDNTVKPVSVFSL